jgi:dTDP-4-dehydrorhamnose reductase
MRFVILGAQGEVAHAVGALTQKKGIAYCGFGRADCDIADLSAVKRAIGGSGVVVNCAA